MIVFSIRLLFRLLQVGLDLVCLILIKSVLLPAVIFLKVVAALTIKKLSLASSSAVGSVVVIAVLLLPAHGILIATIVPSPVPVTIRFVIASALPALTAIIAVAL